MNNLLNVSQAVEYIQQVAKREEKVCVSEKQLRVSRCSVDVLTARSNQKYLQIARGGLSLSQLTSERGRYSQTSLSSFLGGVCILLFLSSYNKTVLKTKFYQF